MKITAVILAAGHGKRMQSRLPKVLHPLGGRPMIHYLLDAAQAASNTQPVVVIGVGADEVRAEVGQRARCVVQEEQIGTAHAVMTARPLVEGQTDLVLVAFADMPLLRPETLQRVVDTQERNSGPITMLTVVLDDPHGFGRVVRGADGSVQAIVEEAVATPEQRAIRELNASVYCIRSSWLWSALEKVGKSPKGEYYLTDLVEIAVREGQSVQALTTYDVDEAVGINTRVYLAEAEAILRKRINTAWMEAGVTMIDPRTTYIEPTVTIGRDTLIYPNTQLSGRTVIGSSCHIGPDTQVIDSRIGNSCTIISSRVLKTQLADNEMIGPYEMLGTKNG